MLNCKKFQFIQLIYSFSTLVFTSIILLTALKIIEGTLYSIIASLFLVITLILFFLFHHRFVYVPLKRLNSQLKKLAMGKLPEFDTSDRGLGIQFQYIQRISNRFYAIDSFANNLLGNSQYTDPKGIDQSNISIANAVEKIENYIDKLKTEAEEWKHKEEERTWANQGIAQFSDLLRQHNTSLENMSQEFLRQLIKYLQANQGGIFLVNDEKRHLEMVAAYAYDRDRHPDKVRKLEDGLLGAVCFEKQSIFMTHLPDNYIDIRSGLGDAPPTSLLLVPLLNEDKVIGVIELASFQVFEKHEIAFVEKIAESLSSTLASAQININTAKLLEQSRNQANELKRQDEELRQNIEEMKSQQEEMERRQHELEESKTLMSRIIDLVPYPIFVKNINRAYIVANQEQAKLFNLRVDQLLGKSDDQLINNIEELNEILITDKKVLIDNQLIKLPEQFISLPDGTQRILQTIKVPFENNITKNRNILGVSIDFTERRELEQKLKESQKRIEELGQSPVN